MTQTRNFAYAQKEVSRINHELRHVGGDEVLVQYHINGIQDYVGGSRRLRVISGASERIKEVDNFTKNQVSRWGARLVFAAAGRGSVVTTAEQAPEIKKDLRKIVTDITLSQSVGLVDIAVKNLASLPAKLAQAKADAPWVRRDLGTDPLHFCQACGIGPRRTDDPDGYCNVCRKAIGNKREDLKGLSTNDISFRGRLAFVAADGNRLGDLFKNLGLQDLALASFAVDYVIAGATEDAQNHLTSKKCLCPIVGGDDVQAFFDPTLLHRFLDTFFSGLDARKKEISPLIPTVRDKILDLSVGMGVAIVDDHTPVRHMRQWAHALEDIAKAHGRDESWVAFASIFTGAEIKAMKTTSGIERHEDIVPFPASTLALQVHNAQALARVPASQRARFTAGPKDSAELQNFFRYQVARDRAWQTYVNEKKDKDGHTYDLDAGIMHLIPCRGEAELAEWLGQK